MREALFAISGCLVLALVLNVNAQTPRPHSAVMRDISNTRGRFIAAALAGNSAAVVEEATKLQTYYKEFVALYEQMKLEAGLKIARQGLVAATEGIEAGKTRNFEAAVATHRTLTRGCRECHPIYRQEAPDGLSYLYEWKAQYRTPQ